MWQLLHALLCVRGLVMQKTSFTDECGTWLLSILTALHAESARDLTHMLPTHFVPLATLRAPRLFFLCHPHGCASLPRQEPDRRLFVAACVRSMREHAQGRAEDGRSLIFIFDQVGGIAHHPHSRKPPPACVPILG